MVLKKNRFKYNFFDFYYLLQYFFKTLQLLLHQKTDVYHSHDFETLLLGYISAKVKRTKLVYDSHELWVERKDISLIQQKIKINIIFPIPHFKEILKITFNENVSFHKLLAKSYTASAKNSIYHSFIFND